MVLHENPGRTVAGNRELKRDFGKKFAPLFTVCEFILNSNLQHQ